MRNVAHRFLSGLLGIAFALPGFMLLTWAAVRLINVQWAFNLAFWAAPYSPVRLGMPPRELASHLTDGNGWVFAAMGGAFMAAVGVEALRGAFKAPRAADQSHDGRARIALETPHPRVGGPLEGTLWLAQAAKPGDEFVVDLVCRRRGASDEYTATPYLEEKSLPAVHGARGWSVPFRFDIPLTAPESHARRTIWSRGFQWQLSLRPAQSWFATRSRFDLVLGPAPVEDIEALHAEETPGQRQTVAALDALGSLMGRGKLLPHEREQLRALSSREQEVARKVSTIPVKILKWGFAASLVLFAWAACTA